MNAESKTPRVLNVAALVLALVCMFGVATLAPAASQAIGDLTLQHTLTMTGDVTPSTITADQNDYAPTGFSTAMNLRLATDASRNLTGLAGGAAGRTILIHNTGGFSLVLKNQSTSSAAANRFAIGADITLTTNTSLVLQYDGTTSRWRAVGAPSSGGGGTAWGAITGTLSAQTDLQTALDAKANLTGAAFTGPTSVAVYQSGNAFSLTTPNPTGATYDTNPIAALYVNGPAAATTRNYIAGIWVDTNAASTDKGRGVAIHNTGASDSLYLQQDGVGSTGIAVLMTTSGTGSNGGVFGTTVSDQTALTLRQETSITPTAQSATLLSVEANGSATEMVRMNSSVASQNGIVFRMLGASSNAFSVLGTADAIKAQLNTSGALTVASVTNQAGSDLTISTSDTNKNILLDPNGTGVVRIIGSDGLPSSIPTLGAKDFLQVLNNGNANISWVVGSSGSSGGFKWFGNGETVNFAGITANTTAHTLAFNIGDGATGPTARLILTTAGNLLMGNAVVETGLTGAGGLRLTSTTDASSGAGSFVTLGGIYVTKSIYADGSMTVNGTQNVLMTADTSTALTLGTHYAVTLNNASPVTVTLPALSTQLGRTYRIKNVGAGQVTVTRAGSDTIFAFSSVTSFALNTGESCDVVAAAASWLVE